MAFSRKRNFDVSLDEVSLNITSRAGGVPKVTVPQKRWDGKEIDKDAVSEQSFILESNGKNVLKIRGAYHEESPFCEYAENTPAGETTTRTMPLPYIKISEFEDISAIPKEIRDKEKGGKIPDYTLLKKDEEGNVTSEAVKDPTTGKWSKADYNVPLYKQYVDDRGDAIKEEKADGSDEQGFFVLTESRFVHVALCDIGFFNGHEVDNNGKPVKDTEGVYMIEGIPGENNFIRLYPMRSGGKVSVGSRLAKVFNHPLFKVVEAVDIVEGKLKEGKFTYSATPVKVAVYNSDGKVAAVLNRPCYKVNKFRAKQSRGSKTLNIEDAVMDTAPDQEVTDKAELENLL
jgi:hypothetical protein